MTLNHRVVAMVGGAAKRVLCLTCNKQHNFRKPKGAAGTPAPRAAAKAGSGSKKAAGAPKVTGTAREWQATVGDRSSAEFVPYSIHTTFEPGQLITHPKFGSGYVKETLASQKLCILFKDGPKTLIHGRS
jgi:hypothetical protein